MISVRHALAIAFVSFAASGSIACGGTASPADQNASEDALSRARFTKLRSGPTGEAMDQLYKAGKKFDSYVGAYRFNKAGPEASDPDAREKRIKEVMHRYMCSFFDESINLGRHSGTKAVDKTIDDLQLDYNWPDGDENAVKGLRTALGRVFDVGEDHLDILSGDASGNNTGGNVIGVYDIDNNEVLFFGFTNCGSDD